MNKEFEKTIKYLKKNRVVVLKTLLPVVLFCIIIIIIAVLAIKPNDNISPSNKSYLFENRNPNFNVAFGSKEKPDKSYVRFEARVSDNPFEQKDRSLWESVTQIFSSKKGFEFGLSQVRLGETNSDMSKKLVEQIGSAIEQMQIDDVTTDTEVIEVGRLLGEDTDAQAKKTVINKDVYPGIDVEYQILEGLGVKEEIVIRNIDEYTANCGSDRECLLPLNEFVFDLKLDEGLLLKESMAVLRAKTDNKYYITDSDDNYIAHFLPTFAVDGVGSKTTGVGLDISNVEGNNYEVVVTLDVDWLFSNERVFPIRIDPSIVHDTTTEFNTGSNYNTEVVTGPKVQLESPEVYYTDSDVVGYWKLDEPSGSGAYLKDSSPNGNDATPTGTTFVKDGKSGGARSFNGVNDYISIADDSTLQLSTSLSLEVWFKTSSSSNTTIARKDTSSGTRHLWGLGIRNGGQLNAGFYNGTSYDVFSSSYVNDNLWHYGVLTINSTTLKLYLDGDYVGSTIISGTQTAPNGFFNIGSAPPYVGGSPVHDFFDGSIDEVRISNVARSANEIERLYRIGYQQKIQGAHTSAPLDMGTSSDIESITWTPVGDNTGDGETPYSTTGLVGQWDF
ncbi:MAG: LamG domain-containing protein, partial [Candidatus Dojkabacteria bacterium]